MMFADLSCERIAELSEASRGAVFAHIQDQATLDPQLGAGHQASVEGTEGESALWVAEQRRQYRRGTLSEDRIGWLWKRPDHGG